MKPRTLCTPGITLLFLGALAMPAPVNAQGRPADYESANGLRARYDAAAIDITSAATWIGNTHRFWYRKLSRGVNEYIVMDAETLQKQPAFDHAKIAASLSKLLGNTLKSTDLQLGGLRFDNNVSLFFATVDGIPIRCTVADAVCTKVDPPTRGARSQGPFVSPNGKWEALINNYNVVVRPAGSHELAFLSTDGSEG